MAVYSSANCLGESTSESCYTDFVQTSRNTPHSNTKEWGIREIQIFKDDEAGIDS